MKLAAVLVPLLAIIYAFPRILVNTLGKENPWTNYFYMYGFGAIFFGFGIVLILKTGACDLKLTRDKYWFKVLIGGFVFFASLHAIWIVLALIIPVKGGL